MRRLSRRPVQQLTTRRIASQVSAWASSRRGYATIKEASSEPRLDHVTTLSNGLRVATEALPGPFAGIGIYLDAGSRYEDGDLSGVSHLVDRLAFKSTKSKSSDQILELIDSLGGSMHCASSREAIMYQSASFNSAVPTTLALLAETLRDPLITDAEVSQQLETAEWEIREIWSKPELILPELVHVAAYKGNTLGNPLLCPLERLRYIDKSTVDKYRQAFLHPERLVVAFAGVQHEEALRLTERYFGDMQRQKSPILSSRGPAPSQPSLPDPAEDANSPFSASLSSHSSTRYFKPTPTGILKSNGQVARLASSLPFFKNLSTSATSNASVANIDLSSTGTPLGQRTPAHYTGGFLQMPKLAPLPNPALPDLTYIHLAFEAFPITSKEIYALATLQTLLGGGGSFSAGGPGKGMYSRLYTNVLNQYSWVESCVAFNHSYTDSGLFGISASCNPNFVLDMLNVMCREMHNLTTDSGPSGLQYTEVLRAKNQLRSALLMNLESRMVELEDLGRQVQVHGRKIGVNAMCQEIEALTNADLKQVARKILKGKMDNPGQGTGAPTVVIQEGSMTRKEVQWDVVQENIRKWDLGRALRS